MSSKEAEMFLDFNELINYIDDSYSLVHHNVDTGYLLSLITSYYQCYEIEKFNINEISQFTKTLMNHKGEPIVTEDNIKYIGLAIDFARSNNPRKKETYWCEFSQKYIFDNKRTEVHTIAKLAVTCISKDYLKSIDLYDERAYNYYLSNKCSNVLGDLDYGKMDSLEEEVLKYKAINE
ncbi:hypothetical protein K4A83_21000 [Spirulina subsalsa FACHB-351]|uniref:Uncharacterized protein n=1 Tax=Spirulina subsalsa FACHB-351 TaxID=234711 RepID=A0ABT3LB60_9CYAN|nr:hypothetical protein [Spirulina subsalsa]MCW6038730.1 hypothetical protein [Spirulina subsalsa FACHB-351]